MERLLIEGEPDTRVRRLNGTQHRYEGGVILADLGLPQIRR